MTVNRESHLKGEKRLRQKKKKKKSNDVLHCGYNLRVFTLLYKGKGPVYVALGLRSLRVTKSKSEIGHSIDLGSLLIS